MDTCPCKKKREDPRIMANSAEMLGFTLFHVLLRAHKFAKLWALIGANARNHLPLERVKWRLIVRGFLSISNWSPPDGCPKNGGGVLLSALGV